MAIFKANTIHVNYEVNYDFVGQFTYYEFAGSQIGNQISHILGQSASFGAGVNVRRGIRH